MFLKVFKNVTVHLPDVSFFLSFCVCKYTYIVTIYLKNMFLCVVSVSFVFACMHEVIKHLTLKLVYFNKMLMH